MRSLSPISEAIEIRVAPADAGRGDQQRDVAMIGAAALALEGQPGDLQLELVDQLEARVDVAPPRVGDRQAVEQVAAGQAEQVGHRAGSPNVTSVAWMRFFSV